MATTRCPVCAIRTPSNHNELEFRGMYFVFCSTSCQERFLRDPEHFLNPRHAHSQSQEAIKRRRLRLGQHLTREEANTLGDLLEGLMGVRAVSFRGDRLEITYDLQQTGPEGLERELTEAGERLGPGWGERLRRAFVHYEEEAG